MKESDLYTYRANVIRTIDGDSLVVDLDLGCGMWLRGERCRLADINAPETWRNPQLGGKEATAWLQQEIAKYDGKVIVKTEKGSEKFGRWIVHVFTPQYEHSLNQEMLVLGLAKKYKE